MFETVNVFTISITISKTKNIMLIVFADHDTTFQELQEFYHKKYDHIQRDRDKFNFNNKGKFNVTSEYFDLACEALNYSCTHS
jgi:alkaline phosphatase